MPVKLSDELRPLLPEKAGMRRIWIGKMRYVDPFTLTLSGGRGDARQDGLNGLALWLGDDIG
jgi:hypothetical protein